MKTVLPLVGLLALVATSATAEQAITSDPSKVESGTYSIEPSHTRVMFSVSHGGFTTYYGEFQGASGTLDLEAKNPDASKLDIKVPVANVWTPSEKLSGELKGDKWLDAAAYPDMTFKSTKVTKTGPNTASVLGDLTLHGVTKAATLKVKFNAAGTSPFDKKYTSGFEVSGTIKRSDFGVKTYVPLIGDQVDLVISAAFEKQG